MSGRALLCAGNARSHLRCELCEEIRRHSQVLHCRWIHYREQREEIMSGWSYQEAVSYIERIPRFAKEKSMHSLERILHDLGNPQESFSYIHVAGTNGKGSVCAYLDSMLREAGVKTGLFTSPHLVTMRERIRIGGEMIGEEEFVRAFEDIYHLVSTSIQEPECGIVHPTFFEWVYLMAMLCFARAGVGYGIIETGLGGRLDATNVIKAPALTIITSIGLDHTQYLGETIPEIAAEKAGIIKRSVPLICDAGNALALPVLADKAKAAGVSPVFVFCEETQGEETLPIQSESFRAGTSSARCLLVKKILNQGKNIDFYLQDMYHDRNNDAGTESSVHFHLPTAARYQAVNASLAFMAFQSLALKDRKLAVLPGERIMQALARTRWTARMDEILPGILVDGAHNGAGVRALCTSLQAAYPGRPVILLFAASSDKDCLHMVSAFSHLPGLKTVVTTTMRNPRAASGKLLCAMFEEELKGSVYCCSKEDTAQAFSWARSQMGEEDLLLCAGSLYLAGEVLDIVFPDAAADTADIERTER